MTDGSDTTSSAASIPTPQDFVLDYLRRGWHIIDLHYIRSSDGTCSCGDSTEQHRLKSAGKHPRNAQWQKARRMDERAAQNMWKPENPRQANVGILTGEPSGFWVLDVDPDNGGAEAITKLQADHAPLTAGRVTQTGSGGWHLHFAMPDFPVTNSVGRLQKLYGKGLDVRGTGGQIVAPPSVSGKGPYATLKDEPIGPAPDWLLDLIRPIEKDKPWTDPTAKTAATDSSPSTGDLGSTATAAPAAEPSPPSSDPRLAKYATRGWEAELGRLDDLARLGWDGPHWDSTSYEVACNLIEIANGTWTPYTINDAYAAFFARAPRDEGFADDRVNAKFESARMKVGEWGRPAPTLTQGAPAAGAPDPLMGSDVRVDPRLLDGSLQAAQREQVAASWPLRTWDDLGNAWRMVDHFGAVLRYVPEADKWATWTGSRWEITNQVRSLVHDMLGSLKDTEALAYDDFADPDDDKSVSERTAFMKFVAKQRMSSRISACLTEAGDLPALRAHIEEFDAHPDMLNVANGIVDLRTGNLLPSDPRAMMMQQCPVIYDPSAVASLWDKFLERCMPDVEMRGYLQRVVGYSLTGRMDEQALFLHHGTGANGKSVFLRAAAAVCGDYGQTVPRTALLMSKSGDSHPTDIARMTGKRLLQVSETAAGKRLDEETVKGLTGGEKQTARYMGKDFFDFTPTGKIHYVTNHLPRLSDAESIWRRLHLIGWRVTIPDAEIDITLGDRLMGELPGILAWMVRGAVEWFAHRLQVPAGARTDLAEYRLEQDEFGEFIATCLVIGGDVTETVTSATEIYGAYQAWCWRSGVRNQMHSGDLTKALAERGLEKIRRDSYRGWRGIAVAPGVATTAGANVPDDVSSLTASWNPEGF